MLSVQPPQTYSMWTRDGVRLDADVYFPSQGAQCNGQSSVQRQDPLVAKFPVLLMRQPYG